IRNGTGPQGEAIVMLGGEHDIFRAGIAKYLRPGIWVPFLDLLIEDGSEVVVVVIRAVMVAVIGLSRRALQAHAVQIPFGIGIVRDVVHRLEIMLRVNQWRPTRNGIESPVDKYSELSAGVPLRKGMLIQGFQCGFVVRRCLGAKWQKDHKTDQNHKRQSTGSLNSIPW